VFIQLAAALTRLGLNCIQQEGLYSILSNNRFTLDLDKGTFLAFNLPSGRILRLRYEPWVFSKTTAKTIQDGVYAPTPYAWSPDILIEFCDGYSTDGTPRVTYAVVVDAKYSARIADHHWTRVNKYWKFRATCNDRQVAMQLWLAFPSDDRAKPTDECVNWGGLGDITEHIDGTVGLLPSEEAEDSHVLVSRNALEFVRDLLRYVDESTPER